MKIKVIVMIALSSLNFLAYSSAAQESSPRLPVTIKAYYVKNTQGHFEMSVSWHSKAFTRTLFEENNTIFSRLFLPSLPSIFHKTNQIKQTIDQIDTKASEEDIKEFKELKERVLTKANEKQSDQLARTFIINEKTVAEITTED